MTRKSLYLGAALLGLIGAASVVLTACSKSGQHEKDPNISYYTCPMHPQIHKDHPGDCPICGMTLVPVYREAAPSAPQSTRISAERQQLIGLKTEAVTKGSAHHVLKAVGFVHQDLTQTAASGPVLVDANLFPGDTDLVKAGAEAIVLLPSGTELTGRVRGVDPIINPATRSIRALIEVPQGAEILRQNHVRILIKSDLGEALTVPRSAVIDTGERKIAFVVTDGDRFEKREVKTGAEAGEAGLVVLEGLAEGDKVVSRAAFLVDAESRLREAVQ